VTTLDITDRQRGLFRSMSKDNGTKARLFGRHALNTTSVVAVSSASGHAMSQKRTNTILGDTLSSQLDSDVTTLLPAAFSIDLARLQVAPDDQPMSLAATILESIDWSVRQPGEIALGIRLALALQDPLLGRTIAAQGHDLYPSDAEIAKMNRVLAPPTAVAQKAATRLDIRSNLNWLADNHKAYEGQWVALNGGQLLAHAGSVDELVAQVGDVRNTNILITQVW